MGAISTKDDALFTRIETQRKLGGAIAGPMEAWLALRGIPNLCDSSATRF